MSANLIKHTKKSEKHKMEDSYFRAQVAFELHEKAIRIVRSAHPDDQENAMKIAERLKRQAIRLGECGNRIMLIQCSKCKQHYVVPKRCESRVCPICCKKFGNRVWHRLAKLVKDLQPKQRRRLSHVVLTLKRIPGRLPTPDDMERIMGSVKKLCHDLWPKSSGCGVISVLEVGKKLNLHVHMITYGFYINKEHLSRQWKKLTLDSDIVYIREVRSPLKMVGYLVKYLIKPPPLEDPADVAHYLYLISGVRRVRALGIFYNCKLCGKEKMLCIMCEEGSLTRGLFDPNEYIPSDAMTFQEARFLKMVFNAGY